MRFPSWVVPCPLPLPRPGGARALRGGPLPALQPFSPQTPAGLEEPGAAPRAPWGLRPRTPAPQTPAGLDTSSPRGV
ncbi:hypothetical protein D1J60_20205 [Streptomyces sp. W1SF4]|nr:hypothetical protein D1J60_20205 [Streptomyces sp. W1SF4]